MLIVLASHYDKVAKALVSSWSDYDAALLTCNDLSKVGWLYHIGDTENSTAVVSGRIVSVKNIEGVLTRLPYICEQELDYIISSDRTYVAAEMTAFLISWLSSLKCPLLNRPTPTGLSGSNLREEQWTHIASTCGLPVRPAIRQISIKKELSAAAEMDKNVVTIVGHRYFGSVDNNLITQSRQLANAVGVDLLSVEFSGKEDGAFFINATLWPDISSNDIADAILEYFSIN